MNNHLTDPTVTDLIDQIIAREGGMTFTDHPADRGGPTFAGITLATARRYFGPGYTVDDLRRMPRSDVDGIYLRMYVVDPKFVHLRDPALRAVVVDFGVLAGPRTAALALQRALDFGGAAVDGVVGPHTLAAANGATDPRGLVNAVAVAFTRHCSELARRDVNQFMARWGALRALAPDTVRQCFPASHAPLTHAMFVGGWIKRTTAFVR
jgi:lysozyme family protein